MRGAGQGEKGRKQEFISSAVKILFVFFSFLNGKSPLSPIDNSICSPIFSYFPPHG